MTKIPTKHPHTVYYSSLAVYKPFYYKQKGIGPIIKANNKGAPFPCPYCQFKANPFTVYLN